MKTRKIILPVILIAILCASIGLTVIPSAKADTDPSLSGPWLIHWKALKDQGIPETALDVQANRLTEDVPYNFTIKVYLPQYYEGAPYYVGVRFYLNHESSGDVRAKDVNRNGDYLEADGTLSFPSTSTYHVGGKIVYYNTQTQYVYQVYSFPSGLKIQVTTHEKPMMSDEQEDGHPLDGPWDMNFNSIPRNSLVKDTNYIFHTHLYHLAYYETDYRWGVKYEYDWGDNTYTNITVPLDGENNPPVDEMAYHNWTSTGPYTVKARAGWYLKSNPQVITWSDWDSMSVTVHPPVQLTVLTSNEYGYQLHAPLYIDGIYVGTTENTYTVSSGNHQIYVQFAPGYIEFLYYYYSGTYNYNNPMTLSITSDKTVTAYWTFWY